MKYHRLGEKLTTKILYVTTDAEGQNHRKLRGTPTLL